MIALVGENGSGKTTLAKVLAGLYPPASGSVLWDGGDIAQFDPAQLRARMAILFQDFVRYQLSASENIGFGNGRLVDDRAAIVAAAKSAGAHEFLSQLPEGYDTMLGPEFYGGVDLSGGQWQRVALARAFLRDARLIILDEPTASLDPRSEVELFARVRELFAGRTVVLISHRFATVRMADHIYVLDRGGIVEHGSHAELMAAEGTYAHLFTLQVSAYGLDVPAAPLGELAAIGRRCPRRMLHFPDGPVPDDGGTPYVMRGIELATSLVAGVDLTRAPLRRRACRCVRASRRARERAREIAAAAAVRRRLLRWPRLGRPARGGGARRAASRAAVADPRDLSVSRHARTSTRTRGRTWWCAISISRTGCGSTSPTSSTSSVPWLRHCCVATGRCGRPTAISRGCSPPTQEGARS